MHHAILMAEKLMVYMASFMLQISDISSKLIEKKAIKYIITIITQNDMHR